MEKRKRKKKNISSIKEKHQPTDHGDSAGSSKLTDPVDNWKNFEYVSWPKNRAWQNISYKHWLKKFNYEDDDYNDFDTIVHVTSFENAEKIFENGELKPQSVRDSSITNPAVDFYKATSKDVKQFKHCHPMVDTDVVWYGPYLQDDLVKNKEVERYGNVVFSMKSLNGFGGIVSEPGDFKYYFVEVVQYVTQFACRILVTKRIYPELLEYDPYKKGGPWLIDKAGKHKHLTKIQGKCNTLEFMREEEDQFRSMWLANHNISYMECINPRHGVIVKKGQDVEHRLALGLLAYKLNKEDNLPLQQWCYIEKEEKLLVDYVKQSIEDSKKRVLSDMTDDDPDHDDPDDDDPDNDPDNDDKIIGRLLEEQNNMKVFDMKAFNKFLLTMDRQSLLQKDCNWAMYLRHCNPLLWNSFLETLIGLIQEKLFHLLVYPTIIIEVLIVPGNFKEFSLESNGEIIEIHRGVMGGNKDGYRYKEFDTLVYTTHLENARQMFEDGKLTPSLFPANSVVKETNLKMLGKESHPLTDVKAMLYLPEQQENMNKDEFSLDRSEEMVVFSMKSLSGLEGIVDRKDESTFKYYLIETVKTSFASVCRILVTKKQYPKLLSYDPNKKGGPWYFKNEKHKCLIQIRNDKGEIIPNKVEFYREEDVSDVLVTKWLINHAIRYMSDKDSPELTGHFRLALGLLACKIKHPDNQVLQHWHFHKRVDDYAEFDDIHQSTLKLMTQKDIFGPINKEIFRLYLDTSKQENVSQVEMACFLQGFLKFFVKELFLDRITFQVQYRKLLLLTDPECSSRTDPECYSRLHGEIKLALENVASHRLYREIQSIPVITKEKWIDFSYLIDHDTSLKNSKCRFVRHWLPKDIKTLYPKGFHNASDKASFYREFDVLVKSQDEKSYNVTMITTFERTFSPVLHVIDDASVVNIRNQLYDNDLQRLSEKIKHPLSAALIYRYIADRKANLTNRSERLEKYGDDMFVLSCLEGLEGIWESSRFYNPENEFNFYLLEIVDFPDESVCRVLATYKNKYPQLLKIDYDKDSKEGLLNFVPEKYQYLSRIKNFDRREVKTKLEVLREVRVKGCEYEVWKRNHCKFEKHQVC